MKLWLRLWNENFDPAGGQQSSHYGRQIFRFSQL